jgi:hypothetical protein
VRGPLRESELMSAPSLPLRLVERPPHPDPLPARGEREKRRRALAADAYFLLSS